MKDESKGINHYLLSTIPTQKGRRKQNKQKGFRMYSSSRAPHEFRGASKALPDHVKFKGHLFITGHAVFALRSQCMMGD
jgi:hypothetical protein